MKPHRLAHGFDLVFQNTAYVLFSFLKHLAPFITPAAPAFFFAHAVYTAVVVTTPKWVAVGVGGAAAMGVESSGIMSAHAMMVFYSRGEYLKAFLALVLFILYLVAGIGGVNKFDGTQSDLKVIGMTMFGITGIVYFVLALVMDINHTETKEDKASDSEAELKRIELANQLTKELAIVGAKKEIAITKANATPLQIAEKAEPKAESKAEATTVCFACGVDFGTAKRLNGHGPARCAKKKANI